MKRKNIPGIAAWTLFALLLSLSLLYPLLCLLGQPSPGPFLAASAVCLLFGAAGLLPRLAFFVRAGVAVLSLLFPFFSLLGEQEALLFALQSALYGTLVPLVPYWPELSLFLGSLCALSALAIARSEGRFAGTLFLFFLFLALSVLGHGVTLKELLPLLLCLLLSMKRREARIPGTVLSCILCLALTFLGLQLLPVQDARLSSGAAQVRQWIDDYLLFTQARTPFSLSSCGYMPLGQSRLGGPAAPGQDTLMQVRTDAKVYLRGTIKDQYTGQAWQDTVGQRRYLLLNPGFAALRRNTFDETRPREALRRQLPQWQQVYVRLLRDSASTLFLTQRFSSLSGQNIVPYFSPASEVFGTRSLAQGDLYGFDALPLSADTPGVRDLVLSCAQWEDPWLAQVSELYLSLPDLSGDASTQLLAESITGQARTDFDRALSICTYLQTHFPYTLSQNVPPEGRDFVSWFLFEEQKGYCTSFASAMCVLCRLCQLPARYVEGFAAVPSEGMAVLTQEDAHAWCEVYFPGFGWLTFDPTPGNGGDGSGSDPDQSPPPAESPDPTPSPTPSPSPSPSPDPSPSPSAEPTPQPSSTPPADTPEPPETPSPPPQPDPPGDDKMARWAPLLLALLVLLALVRLLLCFVRVQVRLKRRAQDSLLVYYLAAQQALSACNVPVQGGEGPMDYLSRAQSVLSLAPPLTDLARAVQVSQYSPRRPGPKALQRAARVYRALWHRLPLKAKVRLALLRLRKGLSLRQLS